MEILDRIIKIMQDQHIRPKDLCINLNLNQQLFTDWKNGKSKSYLKYMGQIADFLDVSITYLYGVDELLPKASKIDFELSQDETDIVLMFHKLSDEQKSKVKSYVINIVLED